MDSPSTRRCSRMFHPKNPPTDLLHLLGFRVKKRWFLGRVAGDSGIHSLAASDVAGWLIDGDLVPESGSLRQVLHTAGYIHDFAAIVRIGDPLQPRQDLEIALLEAPQGVRLVAVSSCQSQWAWAAETEGVQSTVILDEDAFQDCRSVIEELGLLPHVVPTAMTLADRTKLASRGSSIVVEKSRIPKGWLELPGTESFQVAEPVWFGLVQHAKKPQELEAGSVAWLAFTPSVERAGSLRDVLGAFVECHIDLKHLHSFRRVDGSYAFSCTFRVDSEWSGRDILQALSEQGINHRLLAAFMSGDAEPASQLLAPQWDGVQSGLGSS